MMKIGVQTGGVEEAHGIDGAYRIIHEAGFDAADANIDHLYSYQAIVNHQSVPASTQATRTAWNISAPGRKRRKNTASITTRRTRRSPLIFSMRAASRTTI